MRSSSGWRICQRVAKATVEPATSSDRRSAPRRSNRCDRPAAISDGRRAPPCLFAAGNPRDINLLRSKEPVDTQSVSRPVADSQHQERPTTKPGLMEYEMKLTRRDFAAGLAVGITAPYIVSSARAQGSTIKIGMCV